MTKSKSPEKRGLSQGQEVGHDSLPITPPKRIRRPPQPKRIKRMFPLGSLSILIFLLAFLMKLVFVNAAQADLTKVQDFIKNHNADENQFTYHQLKQWFDDQMYQLGLAITPDLYPRLFPFCVTYEQILNTTHLTVVGSKIHAFQHIFKRIKEYHNANDKFYHFHKRFHSIVENKTFVKSVGMSRINTPEPDMINLRQWAHVTVKTTKLAGLYMQAIVGPAGLPVGEFSLEFPCSDIQAAETMLEDGDLVYCHYRPKASVYHPKVFVAKPAKEKTEFHVHYKWADITCLESPYLQFLMIAVKNFKLFPIEGEDYQLIYSEVFLNTGLDSPDGSPYPYHPIWKDKMVCGANDDNQVSQAIGKTVPGPDKKNADRKFAPSLWEVSDNVFRVQPNEEYDACITGSEKQEILDKKDDLRLECPPGPFQCTESYKDIAAPGGIYNATAIKDAREKLVRNEKNTTDCYPCAAPSCQESGFSRRSCIGDDGEIILINDTIILENLERIARTKSHGMLSSLATLVFLPVANFMGRFYKEACHNCLCGNGPWIFVHIILHVLGSAVLWISIGPVVAAIANYQTVLAECQALHSTDSAAAACATEKSIGNPHVPLGVLVFFCQNLMIISGFFRSGSNTIRGFQVGIHSIIGYITFFMAGISAVVAVMNNRCMEILMLMGSLFAVPIIFFVIGCILDWLTDKKVGISPGRKWFPVLEPVKLDKRGPCECFKWIVFGLYFTILIVLWFLVVASSNFSSKMNNPDAFNPDDPASNLANTFKGKEANLVGIFSGVCGTVTSVTDQD